METKPTQLFTEFVLPLLNGLDGVAYVGLSDGERLDRFTAASRSETTYPGVFLFRPKYRTREEQSGQIVAWFEAAVYVLVKGELADVDAQDAAFDEAEGIVTQLGNALEQRGKTYACLYSMNDFSAEPVMYVTMDSAWGYEVKFRLGLDVTAVYRNW